MADDSVLAASAEEAVELAHENRWTDGLPIVPPTRELVDRFLATTARSPSDVVAVLPPLDRAATVEKIAINAAMAGCKPEYLAVVIAAIEAIADPAFNLRGVAASTHGCGPLIVVNGPIRATLDINGGQNAFGPGWRANATIGRAVNLVLQNVGGTRPDATSKSIHGHPGRYTFCFGENEESSPWPSLAVDRGFAKDDSVVTVYPASGPQHIFSYGKTAAYDVLRTIAGAMAYMGNSQFAVMGETMVVIGQAHMKVLAATGWRKSEVQVFLFENARLRWDRLNQMLGENYIEAIRHKFWPHWMNEGPTPTSAPLVRRPQDILLVAAGGDGGGHSAYISGWGSQAVSRRIA